MDMDLLSAAIIAHKTPQLKLEWTISNLFLPSLALLLHVNYTFHLNTMSETVIVVKRVALNTHTHTHWAEKWKNYTHFIYITETEELKHSQSEPINAED